MNTGFILKSIYTFILTIVLQLVLFDNMHISTLIEIPFYIIYITILPPKTPRVFLLLLAFILGATIDYIHGSSGVVTASLLLATMVRVYSLKFLINRDFALSNYTLSLKNVNLSTFIIYHLLIIFTFNTTLFVIENFGFLSLTYTFIKIVASSLLTMIVIYIFEYIYPKRF